MSYIDNEILERLIGTMVEGFARIEKKLDQMNRLKECMKNITRWKRMGNHSILPQRYRVFCSSVVRT